MKSITIAGNIGRDAEVRTTQNGDKITGWTVAVEAGYGQKKKTLWFDCSWFGGRGEKVAPYLRKGGKVTVSGDLDTREHDGKTYLQVRVNDVTLQDGRRDDSQRQDESNRRPDDRQSGYGAGGSALDQDIPFSPCR
ncbi:single-stranded DNA-binding protein [Paenirhodobacter populi]|uniref:single-stranded DNA-binding protein n=1 Tax=Paenirhodobacter populi TaxID=2306993 RepID=UPI000FE2B8ED|nr:single-stranded DNA-binding protein [Sinirhodobacter populi]RWR09774.1 single-stranded DNA-binding protein [Sinirhodobacter populi]